MVIKPNNVIKEKNVPSVQKIIPTVECQKVDKPICPNCKSDHSAGHKLCPKFVKVQNTLRNKYKTKMSLCTSCTKVERDRRAEDNTSADDTISDEENSYREKSQSQIT